MTLLRIAAVAAVVLALSASAKRSAPPEVEPLVVDDVRYEVPQGQNPCGTRGGCVVAFDAATGARRWWVAVYVTSYNPFLEQDVQDVFITDISAQGGDFLEVSDEKGRLFTIDLHSHTVLGGPGCSAVTTSPSVLTWWGLALLGLAWRGRPKIQSTRNGEPHVPVTGNPECSESR